MCLCGFCSRYTYLAVALGVFFSSLLLLLILLSLGRVALALALAEAEAVTLGRFPRLLKERGFFFALVTAYFGFEF